MGAEIVLWEQPYRRIVQVGNTVRRPTYPWSPTIHALLHHLAAVGFQYAPRVLGIDEDGREVLSYLQGESGPQGWAKIVDDAGLVRFARLLRDYHDAVIDFEPPAEATWFTGEAGTGGKELICHGDFGPWNIVWQGGRPVGILDWDYARPGPRLHDVAYALEYVAPFRDDTECRRWLRYPDPPHRRHRLELFAEAYGLTSTAGLVDAVIQAQRNAIAQVRRLANAGYQPQTHWVTNGHLNDLANRHLFE